MVACGHHKVSERASERASERNEQVKWGGELSAGGEARGVSNSSRQSEITNFSSSITLKWIEQATFAPSTRLDSRLHCSFKRTQVDALPFLGAH